MTTEEKKKLIQASNKPKESPKTTTSKPYKSYVSSVKHNLPLLRGKPFKINEHISIRQPTLDDIYEYGEQEYFSIMKTLTCTPNDMKSGLQDMKLDYEKVSEVDMFIQLCGQFTLERTKIIFGDKLDISKMRPFYNNQLEEMALFEVDENNNIVEGGAKIDSRIHMLMTDYIRDMHSFEKNTEKPGNEATKNWLIQEERDKIRLQKDKEFESQLYALVLAAVNCSEFKYNYEDVWDLPISVFMKSIRQVERFLHIKDVKRGLYSGCIDGKKIKSKDLSWICFDK
jgi:hypothetical protein